MIDYCQQHFWAAYEADKKNQPADVFFIHPTTYLCQNHGSCPIMVDLTEENRRIMAENTDPLNAPVNNAALNDYTDRTALKHQASVFGDTCRLFMPRYRQVHVKGFFIEQNAMVKKAFDLAYMDIRAAFLHYLNRENNGRPLIIVGHSQGSLHGIRLLQEFFDTSPLADQLVFACLPGIDLPPNAFKNLPYLKMPEATGGVIGWQSVQQGAEYLNGLKKSFCVNPLTFTDTEKRIIADMDCGITSRGVSFGKQMGVQIDGDRGCLRITLPNSAPLSMREHGNLHLYDYSLFYNSLKANTTKRIKNFI